MTQQLPTGPAIRRLADGSIDYGFYRTEARRARTAQYHAAWRWLSGTLRNAAGRCRNAVSLRRPRGVVTHPR
jgi:hypothetical protein